MSRIDTTDALVIKKAKHQDTHQYVTLFTKEHGKVRVLAKGVRTLKSKNRSSIETFNLIRCGLYHVHGHYVLTEARLLDARPGIKQQYHKVIQAYQLLEILEALVPELEPHPELFEFFEMSLSALDRHGFSKQTTLECIKKMLDLSGFGYPELQSELQLKAHLEAVVERRLRSKLFLTVPVVQPGN